MTGKQTKSKKRVAGNIEVFTSEREVKAMADLERNQTQRIESRFLEPTCGTGNFLAQILNRKLTDVDKRYESAKTEWEFYAISNVKDYGITFVKRKTDCNAGDKILLRFMLRFIRK